MGVWFLIALIIIGVFFAIRIYIYENSEFSKMTNYSIFNIWTNSKVKRLYKLSQSLSKLQGDKKVLLNVILPNSNVIDAIVVHESGIYVINTIEMNGWIYGREQDAEWAQALNKKEELNKFDNPIIDNKKMILDLKEILKVEKHLFHSAVVFTNNCTIKKVVVKSNNVSVLHMRDLKDYWSNKLDRQVTNEEVNNIYNTLESLMASQKDTKPSNMNQTATNS